MQKRDDDPTLCTYEDWILLELCAPELRSDPQSAARLPGSSCCSIGMLALAEMAGPVDLRVVQLMPSSKAYRGDPAPEQHRERFVFNWVKLRGPK